MKNLQKVALCLALLVVFARCDHEDDDCHNHDPGYAEINTPANEDPNSCILNLKVEVESDHLHFKVVKSDAQSCTQQNLQFAPIFRNVAVSGQIDLVPNADNASIMTGNLTKALFAQYDGTACINLGVFSGSNETWLKCQFKFANIFFSVDWYRESDGDWDDDWTGILYPVKVQTVDSSVNNVTVVSKNNSYQDLVGMIYSQCGSGSSSITDLNSNITITGTQYASNNYDLSKDIGHPTSLYAIAVRDSTGAYKVWQPSELWHPFHDSAVCYNLGVSYSTVLQGLNCASGCAMSLIMYTDVEPQKSFVLGTQGFTTQARRLRA